MGLADVSIFLVELALASNTLNVSRKKKKYN
jgi:hypothetical protein